MTCLLQAEQVTRRFGGLVAVSEVDFRLEAGSIAAIIGPNGAGKTTFFNLLAGIYAPSQGTITFAGQNLSGLPTHRIVRLGMSRTFQNIRLFQGMSVVENVLVGMHTRLTGSALGTLLRLPWALAQERQALRRAYQLLEFVGLGGCEDEQARNLPYGHQRLVEVARALAAEPRLLLLDEPAAGMNPTETDALMKLIQRCRQELGLTVLLIEHDMKLVMGISDQVTVLDHGQKIAEGEPAQVAADPRVIEAYLGPAEEGA